MAGQWDYGQFSESIGDDRRMARQRGKLTEQTASLTPDVLLRR